MQLRNRKRPPAVRNSIILEAGGWVLMVLCCVGWFGGFLDDRQLIGITLVLSWATWILDARNGRHITE